MPLPKLATALAFCHITRGEGMALRLRVTGPRAHLLGERATRVFGVHGGRIGRAGSNEWVLPDAERFMSGHHAAIEHRGGYWYVVDTSSNGTYLNQSSM